MSGEELKDYQLDGEFKNWPRRPDLMTANALYLFAAMGNMLLVAARALFSYAGMLSAPLNAALGCVYEAGVLLVLLRMGIALVIFAVLMLAASSDREKQQRPFEREGKVDRKKLGWRELVVLLSAVVTVIGLYALDLCGIVGLM